MRASGDVHCTFPTALSGRKFDFSSSDHSVQVFKSYEETCSKCIIGLFDCLLKVQVCCCWTKELYN